ncbi:MAG: site-specific integrase, partial [Planctomycetes bacterium]|nr:site-specific integrase [Planctomycetota bacterium]
MLSDFADYLRIDAGLALNTLEAYRTDLELLRQFTDEHGIVFPDDVDRRTIVLFLGWCRDRGHSTRTIRRRLSAIRTFYGFLAHIGLIDRDPAREVLFAKDWSRLPKTLSVPQVEALLRAPLDLGAVTAQRDRALLELLYEAGLRVSEICGLRWGQVFAVERYARVRGKGGKERIVPFGHRAHDAIRTYRTGERCRVIAR